MIDQGFPFIVYNPKLSPRQWGEQHGESFRVGIKELVEIRTNLMLQKNPKLKNKLSQLAQEQFDISQKFAPDLSSEIQGLASGSGLSLTDLVILNNYTDFRDIQLPDEGCSTVHVNHQGQVYTGQTWDMHASAKNYMCMLQVPAHQGRPEAIILSLVGCLGLMGVNTSKALIGVNNINTRNARTGLIWPLLVRRVLYENDLPSMRKVLTSAPVTSGHNYMLSDPQGGEHWEISPDIQEQVCSLGVKTDGPIFHTNHCLGAETQRIEERGAISSTTFDRYELLKRKASKVNSLESMRALLTDHENYPKSLCSHFESGAQDPSFTCAGGAVSFSDNRYLFWRGCPEKDQHYRQLQFAVQGTGANAHFQKV